MLRHQVVAAEEDIPFTGKELMRLILPLIVEQFLAVAVGMVDTIMVSGVGESAMAAISTVDTVNSLFIQMFSAMSAGGAVVAAQYLGRKDLKAACTAANQLMLSTSAIALMTMGLTLIFYRQIIGIMDNGSDPAILTQSYTYLLITACSFPALGVYNGGVGLMRVMGDSKTSMMTSAAMNLINICGNALLINVCHMGVAGAAVSTLFSRTVAAVVIVRLLFKRSSPVHLSSPVRERRDWRPDWPMIRRIFHIGVPNGVEGSLFQLGKVLIMSIVTTFSTSLRAANAAASIICGFPNIPGCAIGIASITVVGQLIGAGRKKDAKRYAKRLLLLSLLSILPFNLAMFFVAPFIIGFFNLSAEGAPAAVQLLRSYAVMSVLIWVFSWRIPECLHAAGDVRYPMVVSVLSMLILRIGACYLFVYVFNLSLMGVWYAMYADWVCRSACFLYRFCSGKWLDKRAI